MAIIDWQPLKTYDILAAPGGGPALEPPVQVQAPWTVVMEQFGDATHLRIIADGEWTAMPGLPSCGPDGLAGLGFPDDGLLLKECPVGALLGRIGGGSATVRPPEAAQEMPAGESKRFGIGTHCVVKVPDNAVGPLFVAFNVLRRPVSVMRLRIEIAGGTVVLSG